MTDKKHQLGDKPIQDEYRTMMRSLATELDRAFNGSAKGADRKVGFVMLVFEYGDKSGRCHYISNGADRKDIVTLFKEQIKRFEGQPEMEGKA
jgi:hypothetical protein